MKGLKQADKNFIYYKNKNEEKCLINFILKTVLSLILSHLTR